MAQGEGPIPPWLAAAGSRRRPGGVRAAAARGAAALVLVAAGAAGGYLWRDARAPAPAPPAAAAAAPAPAGPPPASAAPARAAGPAAAADRRAGAKKARQPAAAADLVPLPDAGADDPDARKAALRRFAGERAPELRACLAGADAGARALEAAHRVGAAIETDIGGAVDEVRIIGAEPPDPRLRRCYAEHIRRWTFPRDLVRGRERILVTFAF